ncbi:hypothetical protein CCR83_02485 [Rhodobacter veldkampii DSM 11550]|uniref:Rhamnogalacturonase A/B/Epimerase-like pectate lyase domain-containing protein n=1 Tax=Phaeovulum veldkampii DSM 11550 TaxID=1185920 RepID=A0A2T4JMU7_9RHOB|nr:glycosyl hydrolase family 28-related protein [Phaeovulum veldkampii]MBK5945344.1 hypothetical protein [Phaeovulum veldkampii DSM 11550]PTE19087.1 hypothetical protein C5F46_01250 [Phaeovulum veldkampii DSM 11550]TDQ61358.1 pectate lyase-like protein [Phaeovulum veldkampii DSM 11550]
MNKAITDGLLLMPPAFGAGLDVWSSEDGTPGQASYQGAYNAALVAADQDFGPCLELVKTTATQKLRYMGETPILPGCYLRITARVKVISGNLPGVRIAGWAGGAGGVHVEGLVETGPEAVPGGYGEVVTVSAIVGTGARGGVDMPWGLAPIYGHFGLDLTGANGGVVRIESIAIEDVTAAWLREMVPFVDVRDFGAVGDGVTDDRAAFAAADAAAAGRGILVPEGSYYLSGNLSLNAPVRFVGTLVMPLAARLLLLKSYDFPTYAAAFGDEDLGFRKAVQALFYYTDHTVLNLKGRRVELTAPVDLRALLPDLGSFSNRRVIANGQINVIDGPGWASAMVSSQASYDIALPDQLTAVANIASIPVGARVAGTGVGREVYVKAVNVVAGSLTLSQPLHGGSGSRSYSFTRDRYILDLSGMERLDRLNIAEVEFLCNGVASAVMLPPEGDVFAMRDCWVMRPKDRAITSIGRGCQGMLIDRCHFLSNEMSLRVQDRSTIALNVNANDVKIRENRFVRFAHFMVAAGTGHLILGNHWFQGDEETQGLRSAGLVLAQTNVLTSVTGNYIDNAGLEWTNEYAPDPAFGTQYSFGGLTVTGNTFLCSDMAPGFRWISVRPYGAGHFIHGLNLSGNVFKAAGGTVERIERVDTTVADLDYSRMRNVVVEGNTFNGISQFVSNPATLEHDQATAQTVWTLTPGAMLPFGGWARNVEGVVAEGMISGATGARITEMPFVQVEQGAAKQQLQLNWSQAAKGRVQVKVRMDNLA